MLCDDMINEILHYCDDKSITSFHLINRHMVSKSSKNKIILNRRLLGSELKKTIIKKRKYYKSEILNLSYGDRITDRNYNYRVCYVEKKMALLEMVDMYGHIVSNDVCYAKIETIKNYRKSKANVNSLFWATYHYDGVNTYVSRLMYGIIKHDYGPIINHVDSVYLNHITSPQLTLYKHNIGIPQYNMIVTVNYKWVIYEYYISDFTLNKMQLTIIANLTKDDKNPDRLLNASKVNDKWIVDNKKYSIILFGGWINYF